MDGQRVNIEQAIDLCRVSRRTLYNWMTSGRLSYTLRNGSRLVSVDDVAWLRDHRGEGTKKIGGELVSTSA